MHAAEKPGVTMAATFNYLLLMLNSTKLSRAEMRHILGGYVQPPSDSGTCAAYLPTGQGAPGSSYDATGGGCTNLHSNGNGTYSATIVGISSSDAQAITNGISGAHWCCTSCTTASWYQPCS